MSVESSKKWLQRAKKNLDVSMSCKTNDPAMSCYLSQQSIETSIKTVIVFENKPVPHIHNIGDLIRSVPDGWRVKNTQYDWGEISGWVKARHPDGMSTYGADDAAYGIKVAQDILDMVKDDIERRTK